MCSIRPLLSIAMILQGCIFFNSILHLKMTLLPLASNAVDFCDVDLEFFFSSLFGIISMFIITDSSWRIENFHEKVHFALCPAV